MRWLVPTSLPAVVCAHLVAACSPNVASDQVAVRFSPAFGRPPAFQRADESSCSRSALGYVRIYVECMEARGYTAEILGQGGVHLTTAQLPEPPPGTEISRPINRRPQPYIRPQSRQITNSTPRNNGITPQKQIIYDAESELACSFKMHSFSGTPEFDTAVKACMAKEAPAYAAKRQAIENADKDKLRKEYNIQ